MNANSEEGTTKNEYPKLAKLFCHTCYEKYRTQEDSLFSRNEKYDRTKKYKCPRCEGEEVSLEILGRDNLPGYSFPGFEFM